MGRGRGRLLRRRIVTTTEEYSDIQADIPLDTDLWDAQKWTTADRTYFQIKNKNI